MKNSSLLLYKKSGKDFTVNYFSSGKTRCQCPPTSCEKTRSIKKNMMTSSSKLQYLRKNESDAQ